MWHRVAQVAACSVYIVCIFLRFFDELFYEETQIFKKFLYSGSGVVLIKLFYDA